ncbi:MAG: hypothetical protein ACFCUQ_04640 [Kiloniellales bacterium]
MGLPPRDLPPPPGPLPIWETVTASYRSVFVDNLNHLPNAVAGPFVLSLMIMYLFFRLGIDVTLLGGNPTTASGWLGLILAGFVSLVPYVIFAVAWHRLILLGPAVAAPTVIPGMTNRHWRFYGYSLLLILLGIVVALVIVGLSTLIAVLIFRSQLLGGLVALATVAVALAVILRLSLVLPPTAIDKHYGIGDAFRLSEKQGFRLLVAFIVISIPFVIVNFLIDEHVRDLAAEIDRYPAAAFSGIMSLYIWIAIYTVINYLGMAIGVSFLSLSFMHLSGWRRENGGEATPPPPTGDAGFHSS